MAPKSVLNDLRRRVVEELLRRRRDRSRHTVARPGALKLLRSRDAGTARAVLPPEAPQLAVLVRSVEQLLAVLDWAPPGGAAAPSLVYCEFQDLADYANAQVLAAAPSRRNATKIAPALPRILRPGDEAALERMLRPFDGPLLVRNLAELAMLRHHGARELVGDYSLNAANDLTVDFLLGLGLCRVVPSFDLSWPQLQDMLPHCRPETLEIVLHHHMPMFHTQHCLAAQDASAAGGKRGQAPISNDEIGASPLCGRPCRGHLLELEDRNGERHAVLCDALCRNTVHNSHAQSAAQMFVAMSAAGLHRFRIEMLRESAEQAVELLDAYTRLLSREDGGAVWRRLKERQPLTRGTWTTE
jgi:putative protease